MCKFVVQSFAHIPNQYNRNIKPIKNYSFLMPPLYLVIYFEGKDLTDKKLDEVITLPRYLGRIEPMKYTLFAFIKENNNTHDYIAFIKFNNIWFEYNIEKMEKVEFPIFDSTTIASLLFNAP